MSKMSRSGTTPHLTWNPKSAWIFSDQPAHEALISTAAFEQIQLRLASRGPRSTEREITRRNHPYAFRGLLFHESCQRRIQGTWNHDKAHYRCRYPSEYALANHLDHPPSVYLREDQLSGPIDAWLAEVFHPDHLEYSLTQLENAQPMSHRSTLDAARRSSTEHDQKLSRNRVEVQWREFLRGTEKFTSCGVRRDSQARSHTTRHEPGPAQRSPQGKDLGPHQCHVPLP
ncbi:hypothetical protein [Nocardia arthritidis]|uniref:hypothetical protein n=1 Tax=Nocardia arthritidis TaxID=228602 RepID=UPI001EEA3DF0|nr:hypothetical protein [Nocardia arthritidis]